MDDLKDFMFVFRFEPQTDYQPSPQEMNAQKQKWGIWIGGIASQAKLVSTHQLGSTGRQLHASGTTTDAVMIRDKMMVGGNMVVKAKTLDEATEMAKGCPILGTGGVVEVRDTIMNM